jgi:hypothetical protein
MLRYVIVLTVFVAVAYELYQHLEKVIGASAMISVLLVVPMIAWVGARLIVGSVSATRDIAHRSVDGDAQGSRYVFDNRSLRFYLVNDTAWVAADDIAPILQPPPDGRELRFLGSEYAEIPLQDIMGISEAGLLRLLTTRTSHRRVTRDMVRLKAWLEKETLPNLKRLPSSYTAHIAVADARQSKSTSERT